MNLTPFKKFLVVSSFTFGFYRIFKNNKYKNSKSDILLISKNNLSNNSISKINPKENILEQHFFNHFGLQI